MSLFVCAEARFMCLFVCAKARLPLHKGFICYTQLHVLTRIPTYIHTLFFQAYIYMHLLLATGCGKPEMSEYVLLDVAVEQDSLPERSSLHHPRHALSETPGALLMHWSSALDVVLVVAESCKGPQGP
jgi:hypothetical protein